MANTIAMNVIPYKTIRCLDIHLNGVIEIICMHIESELLLFFGLHDVACIYAYIIVLVYLSILT